ncbi:hypothetical protein [Escherichia phage IMM-001]|nr:hypothetical protein [Escherichia phage IMM-001]
MFLLSYSLKETLVHKLAGPALHRLHD